MSNKMLIDASHPEEIRVVVTKGNRIEEFDFESEHKKQLKGNIYLARVTRVEPSLQAAFIEYGGNRHGFLAFSEIHPDYYQIPLADRQALLQAQERSNEDDEAEYPVEKDKTEGHKKTRSRQRKTTHANAQTDLNSVSDTSKIEKEESDSEEKPVDLVGTEDALEELPTRNNARGANWRDYKIQEVIKRRQILLVQVVKEERGNKGAALTTYLSLAGRYSVLMPNTARGGGISRKITNTADRKRLKDIVKGLSVPHGMGIILRTAGASRTKAEVRRDYEYLMRLWENVRNLTLTSIAPALVYEEGSLIKRSIRDLYNKNIDEISVAGEKGYREAKDFMRMLMPSHAKFVQPYRETTPIFAHSGIETQLDGMLQPEVGLKSGGYLVINQTEALVAIDVNSGRSTRESSVEETALQTNLEAAEEVARQLRLRDLAGLVVIDFIDMQEKRNIRAVEKKLKDCLKDDRARIQLGHISHFGLMEMSRQRIRASVLESTTRPCPHCFGTGYVRSQSSLALHVLRIIEEYLQRSAMYNIAVRTPTSTALYVLNHKKRALTELEEKFSLTIDIEADDTIGKEHLMIHKTSEVASKNDAEEAKLETISVSHIQEKGIAQESPGAIITEKKQEKQSNKDRNRHKNTDRRKAVLQAEDNAKSLTSNSEKKDQSSKTTEEEGTKRRRRGRRGGRRNRDAHNGRIIPQAEPVGSFSEQSAVQPEQNSAVHEQKGKLPKPEPVGFSSAKADTTADRQNKRKASRRRSSAKAKISAEKTETGVKTENKTGSENVKQPELRRGENIPEKQAHSDRDNQNLRQNTKSQTDAGKDTPDNTKISQNTGTETIVKNTSTQRKGINERSKNRTKRTDGAMNAASEPVLTSSNGEDGTENKPKKKGWWGRKNFF